MKKMPESTKVSLSPSSKAIAAWFKRISNKLSDFTISNKAASITLDRWVQRNFKSEGGKVGGWLKSKAAIERGGMRRAKNRMIILISALFCMRNMTDG